MVEERLWELQLLQAENLLSFSLLSQASSASACMWYRSTILQSTVGHLIAGMGGTSHLCWDANGWIAELQVALLLAWGTGLWNLRVSAEINTWLLLTLVLITEKLHIIILWAEWHPNPRLNNKISICLYIFTVVVNDSNSLSKARIKS